MSRLSKIDHKSWYSLSELVAISAFPFCGDDIRRYRYIVEADNKQANILNPVISGIGRAKRYRIQGENIISFIKLVELGKVKL